MAVTISTNRDILTGRGDRPDTEVTSRLLLALTALYVQRPTHTVEEQQQYGELALRLIDKVDAPTRDAVAGILQRHPHAPAEIFEHLRCTQSSLSGDLESDTHSIRDQQFAGDQHLANGERAPTPAPFAAAPAVPQATDTTPEFAEAFFAASPAERRRMLSLIAPSGSHDVPATSEDGERTYGELDVAALHGRTGEFTCEFERMVNIPNSLCERILNDPSGEPMVIVAKASGVPIAILQRILLLVNPAVSHSVQRVYDLTELYHGLDRSVARDIVAAWRARAKRNDPTVRRRLAAGDCKPGVLRDTSVASLRSRFGALADRLQGQAINARPGPGSVAPRGLRSR
ncbi:MAG TPA: DUF2336 domain-containing protein [Xanthobacteraceae bacterium]|nr:DUF2336 domain-containing protein [Xanthobacteraceae bacterium]